MTNVWLWCRRYQNYGLIWRSLHNHYGILPVSRIRQDTWVVDLWNCKNIYSLLPTRQESATLTNVAWPLALYRDNQYIAKSYPPQQLRDCTAKWNSVDVAPRQRGDPSFEPVIKYLTTLIFRATSPTKNRAVFFSTHTIVRFRLKYDPYFRA